MKKALITLILICVTISAVGQNDSITKNNSIAFEQYLSKTFAQYYPFPMLQRIYKYLSTYPQNSNTKDRYIFNNDSMGRDYLGGWVSADCSSEGPIMCYTDTYQIGKEQGFHTSHRHYDDRVFPDSLRFIFKQGYAEFRTNYPKKSVAQKELIETLKNFDKSARNRPLFFADIHKTYNDDIEAYIKDMFKTSILIDNKQNQRFLRKPSAEKLQNDAGVRFVIGVALYKLWLTQQGEDNKSQK